MNIIEEYFNKKTEDITFIELREDSDINIGDIVLDDSVPLPIITSEFLEEIKRGSLGEEISLEHIVDGMIDILGADKEFPSNDIYIKILEEYNPNIEEYILYLGMKELEKENIFDAAIKFRSILSINDKNVKGLFNYSLCLENIALTLIEEDEIEKASIFLTRATNLLEEILDIDEDFTLSYYKLGFHYKNAGQFLKASLIWEKFLKRSEDDLLNQDIREEIDIIQDDTNLESAITYLMYEDFNKALGYLMKLIPKFEDEWEINLYIGQAHKGLGDYELAIDYFNKALSINNKVADIYNEIGIMYFELGNIEEAINVLSEGIDNCEEDYKLYFNRGLGYIELNKLVEGLSDIDRAEELNPNDPNVKKYKEQIEKQIDL